MFGIDYSMGIPDVTILQQHKVEFICRYTGFTSPSLPQSKILTPHEAGLISSMGMFLVSNFEWYNLRPQEGFDAGMADALTANKIHLACGGPMDKPIYFSVDYNSNGSDVVDYFKGIASILGIKRVGVYGGYWCCRYLHEQGLATYLWQTYAWSGGVWYPAANIHQTLNAVMMGNIEVDEDESVTADFGQWKVSNTMLNANKLRQWNDMWDDASGEDSAGVAWSSFRSGIYNVMWQAHNAGLVGLTQPATGEVATEDWNGNACLGQLMVNGFYCIWQNGQGFVYNNLDQLVFQGFMITI